MEIPLLCLGTHSLRPTPRATPWSKRRNSMLGCSGSCMVRAPTVVSGMSWVEWSSRSTALLNESGRARASPTSMPSEFWT